MAQIMIAAIDATNAAMAELVAGAENIITTSNINEKITVPIGWDV
jgi:hypothetical protein